MIETAEKTRGIGAIGRARASVAAITTLAKIRQEARTVATDAERAVLREWSGWGPLTKLFTPDTQSWVEMAEEVTGALTREDLDLGMRGTYMAFYTPDEVAAGIWEMLRSFGWDGGPVAELGCGGGAFFKAAPEGTPLVGVERDPTAAAICGLLHPNVRVINAPLEDTSLPDTFTAVVGNVPFGDVRVFDPDVSGDDKELLTNLHDYFLWRAVKALRPGGYAIMITSRHTMDAWKFQRRSIIGRDADFVGAVRLPNGALGGGTDALADIVVLRRKGGTDLATHGHPWTDTTAVPWDAATSVNQWWFDEPGSVLGTMGKGSTNQYGLNVAVEAHRGGPGLVDRLLDYTRRELVPMATARNLLWTPPPNPAAFDVRAAGVMSKEGWIEGSMRFADDGGVLVVKDGRAAPLPKPKDELVRLLRLRDLALNLVQAEADHKRSDVSIEPIRADVRAAYQAYVKLYGPVNRYTQSKSTKRCGQCGPCEQYNEATKTKRADVAAKAYAECERPGIDPDTGQQQWTRTFPTMQGFRHDPDAMLVFALEVFDDVDEGDAEENEAGMRARPADIQHRRQNVPPVLRTRTDDPVQALAWSLDRFGGKVRMDYIALVLGQTVLRNEDVHFPQRAEARDDAIAEMLGDRIYLDPATLRWLTAEEYLSGDVRGKHRTAEQAAGHNDRFTRNVAALAAVLPRWLGPEDITANLGTPWIGPEDVELFIKEVVGYAAPVTRAGGQWEVNAQGGVRGSVAATGEWGAAGVDAYTLIQLALNGKTPTVYKTIVDANGDEKRVKDHGLSMLACEKQQEIRARFSDWVWTDAQRTRRLVKLYNERYNNLVPRRFDGSHITIQGLAPWFDPYAHQLEMVARGIVTPASLCGLPVGSGKTNIMAMLAMKLRQLGLINKPMIVVPNHLIEQVAREIMQLFPAAKVLVGSSKTVSANRRAFTARCTTGDWDMVLVTHSAFNSMDVDPDTQAAYLNDLAAELRDGVIDAAGGQLKGRMVKGLAKQLDRMRAKVQDLRDLVKGRDAGVRFEQLGVDFLLVDEFHYYKNLAVACNTEGFSVKPSKRATDLDMKLRYLRDRNNGGPHAALFSGTPVSNTMLELYVCLHYTMRPYLNEIGIGSADAWAAAYVQFVTSVEVTVDGSNFQMKTRPALFVNAPELRVLLSQTADIRTDEQLGLKKPAMDLRVVACEPTGTQGWFSTELVERADDVRTRAVLPHVDNMLKICTDGRRMATDPHLVGLVDDEEYKLHIVARHMIEVWRANPGKLQIGFLDLGTPKQRKDGPDGQAWMDYQSYGRLRRMLTEAGMDVSRIRFIHSCKSDADRSRLFRDCKTGKVDVVFGSTDKLGVGTNIQKLVVAMHHIDAPFRPADVAQRDGRGLRPGNIHATVMVFRYVTKRTFDAYMWQMLTRKLTFIGQMLSGNLDRTVEDMTGDDVLSFAAIKAAATDQPLLEEKATVDALIKKLTLKERSHRQTVSRMRSDAPGFRESARRRAAQAKAWEAIAAGAEDLDLSDDETVEQIHAAMDGFRYYRPPMRFGRITVTWRFWNTRAEKPEIQPLLVVNGGDGTVEEEGYRFWKPTDVKRRLQRLIDRAPGEAERLRRVEQEKLDDAAKCDELAERPFDQAGELTAARARLDRIEAELRDAASDKTGPTENDAADIVLEADIDLAELADFASGLGQDADSDDGDDLAEVAVSLADLFA
jgi:N12 class adenine-specific DNA methylase